jgi:hypothetical protein
MQVICSDIVYNIIYMWLRNSTPASRDAWLGSLDAVAALEPSTILAGHKDPGAPGRQCDPRARPVAPLH